MTRLWILSDLHLEAVRHPDAFRPEPPEFDVLVVAGDVWQGHIDRGLAKVARLAADRPAVMVPGNHEFWNQRLEPQRQRARDLAPRYGVTLLDDATAVLAGVRFVGGTLWGDGSLAGPDAAPEQPTGEPIGLGEGVRPQPVTGADQAALHRATRAVIASVIHAQDPEPLVVVTHHAPHPCCLPACLPACLPPSLRHGWIAGHTASDLSELTDAGRAALWIHGHIHQTIEQQRPGGTRLICNAAGSRFHNRQFREDWVVEVPTFTG